MSTWSEGYREEINKLKSDLSLLERSLAKSELKRHKLEEQLNELDKYFKSANSIPVERATILAKEYRKIRGIEE